jgi:hypothetical protein
MQPQPARRRRPVWIQVWRNPLARGVDRAEAAVVLILLTLWLVALPIVATVGSVSWADSSARSAEQQRSLASVQAVVEQDAQLPIGAGEATPVWITVPVSWTGSDGQQATGVAEVAATAAAGDHVTVWLDSAGRIVPAPASSESLAGLTLLVGAGTWILIGLVLLVLGWAVRRRLDRRRWRAWGQEWAQVEPGRHPF